MRKLTVRIKRVNPLESDEAHFDTFIVEEKPRMSVLILLDEIKETKEPGLYYEAVCRSSICGSCAVKINGQPRLLCKTQVAFLPSEIVLEPLDFFPLIKDLATDKHLFFEKLNQELEAWVHRLERFDPGKEEEKISQSTASKIYEADRCIECGICISACPSRSQPGFIGACGMNKGFRFLLDPRQERKEAIEKLIEKLSSDKGLWGCSGIGACQNFCPKEIPLERQLANTRKTILKLILKEWFKKIKDRIV